MKTTWTILLHLLPKYKPGYETNWSFLKDFFMNILLFFSGIILLFFIYIYIWCHSLLLFSCTHFEYILCLAKSSLYIYLYTDIMWASPVIFSCAKRNWKIKLKKRITMQNEALVKKFRSNRGKVAWPKVWSCSKYKKTRANRKISPKLFRFIKNVLLKTDITPMHQSLSKKREKYFYFWLVWK